MKLLKYTLLLTICHITAAAEEYHRTQGPLTVSAADYSNQSVSLPLAGLRPFAEVKGLWVTACPQDRTVTPTKAVLEYRTDGKTAAKVEAFSPMSASDVCTSTFFLNVKLSDVINLSIVTASVDFKDMY